MKLIDLNTAKSIPPEISTHFAENIVGAWFHANAVEKTPLHVGPYIAKRPFHVSAALGPRSFYDEETQYVERANWDIEPIVGASHEQWPVFEQSFFDSRIKPLLK